MFTSEYQNINSNGLASQSLIIGAEVVSCAKRTLARNANFRTVVNPKRFRLFLKYTKKTNKEV